MKWFDCLGTAEWSDSYARLPAGEETLVSGGSSTCEKWAAGSGLYSYSTLTFLWVSTPGLQFYYLEYRRLCRWEYNIKMVYKLDFQEKNLNLDRDLNEGSPDH